MAGRGKNEVTLTFSGDADKLEKEIKRVDAGTKDLESAFKRVGDAAQQSEVRLGGLGDRVSGLDRAIGKGGADIRKYRSDLDGAGEGFNDLEDRAMGAGNIIGGFQDVMKGGSEGAASFAMGLSDLAAGVRYTVVPSLQDGAKGFQNIAKSMGGMKNVLLGGGLIAATVGLAFALQQAERARRESQWEDTFRELRRGAEISQETALGFVNMFAVFEDGQDRMLDRFRQIYEEAGPRAAQALIDQAEAAGADEEATQALRDELKDLRIENNDAEQSIRDVTDALQEQQERQRAMIDPLFAYVQSQRDLTSANQEVADAQKALTEAQEAGDPVALTEAQRALEDALLGQGQAALDAKAQNDLLFAGMNTGGATVEDMRAKVDELERQGYLTGDAAAYLRDRINEIKSKEVKVTADIWNATRGIGTVAERLAALDKDVVIKIHHEVFGVQELNRARALADSARAADGGVIYAAAGYAGGPRGTDTVPAWLTPGEMVLNKGQQQNLFNAIDSGMLGGWSGRGYGSTVNVYVQGSIRSDRELVRLIRDELDRGGLR